MKAARVLAKHQRLGRAARVARVALLLALLAALGIACGQTSSVSGPGEECFAASDCAPGLVCVPQRLGSRICSSDLSQVTGRPPAAPAEAGMAEGGDATTDGMTDGPPDAPVQDTGTDTGIVDAGDAG